MVSSEIQGPEGERIEHYETRRVRKDGKLIHISVTISPLKDADGVIVGASKIARDIGDQKEAEEALRNAQGRYKQTLDQLLEGCQIIDFDWRHVYINDVGASHGRLRKEDLLGKTMMEVYPGIEGTDMFGMLRESQDLKRIPIVILTSSRQETDLIRSYDLGVNGYVVKPVEFGEFMEAVKQLGIFWAIIDEPPPRG